MADDIVTRLRNRRGTAPALCDAAADEIEHLRKELHAQQAATEQWWFLARQYRNSSDHAGCLGNRRCKFCETFHRNETMYGNGHGND